MANYINYDNNLVDLDLLNSSLADSWESWATRKYGESKLNKEGVESNTERLAFVDAYNDIMSRGITGSEIRNGKRYLKLNGADPQYTSLGQQRAYQQAAGFILDLMSGLATAKKEEEEIKNKTKIGNGFQSNFSKFLGNRLFGNANWHTNATASNDWLNLDSKDSNNRFYNTDKRQAELAKLLEAYKSELKEEDLDFTDSPFKDYADLTSRIDRAIAALRNPELNDEDKAALNALGFDRNVWLATGRELPYTLPDGSTTTYGEYYDSLDLLKAKAELLKQQAIAQANRGVLARDSGIRAVDAIHNAQGYSDYLANTYGSGLAGFNKMNLRIQALLNKSYNNGKVGGLTPAEKKELGNLIHYVRTNNPKYLNYNLTLEEADELNLHPNLIGNGLQDFVRLPWQTPDSRYTYADKSGNIYYLKPKDLKKLAAPTLNRAKMLDYKNYMSNFGMSTLLLQLSTPLSKLDLDIKIADGVSILSDLVSLSGGYVGATAGAMTLLSDLYADIRRGKSIGDVVKNTLKNAAWGAAGFVPGLKLARLASRAARVYAAYNSWGIITDDNVHKSWKKLINKQDLNSQDLENIKYTIHAAAGLTNIVRGSAVDYKTSQLRKNSKVDVLTKSGTKTLTQEQVKEINRVGSRKGQKAAENKFKEITGEEAKPGQFNFLENGRAWFNPTRYSARARTAVRKATDSNEKVLVGTPNNSSSTAEINRLLELDKAKPIFANPFKAQTWKNLFTAPGPNRGAYLIAFGNASTKNSTPGSSAASAPARTTSTPKNNKVSFERASRFEFKALNPKGTSSRLITPKVVKGALLPDGNKYTFSYAKDGTAAVLLNGKIVKTLNSKNQGEAKLFFADFIKSINNRVKTLDIGLFAKRFSNNYKKTIVDLKRAGFLYKQGGAIQNFLKEYNI